MRPVSLRARLVLLVLGLIVIAQVLTVGAIFGALQDLRGDQTDDVMTSLVHDVSHSGEVSPVELLEELGVATPAWQRLARNGEIPSFYQVRSADGAVLQTMSFGAEPDLPAALPPSMWPRPATQQDGYGNVVLERDSREANRGDQSHWRVLVSRVPGRQELLLLGMRTESADDFVDRVHRSSTVVAVVVFIILALLVPLTVRRQLRPLDQMGVTAAAIGAGQLQARVEICDPRTEVGRLGAALNGMLGQIERAFRSHEQSEQRLRRFVADASHELRTPIATISGYAELFRRGAAARPDDLADAMQRIESEARRMGRLVDELLLLARLDQGRPLERYPVELADVAEDAVKGARAVEPERPIAITTESCCIVEGDAAKLRQVLDNLLSNARSHTPRGTAVQVAVVCRAPWVVVEVSDAGAGIPVHLRERVFERFFRHSGHQVRPRDEGGAGLGLAIVQAVVLAHDGDVSVEESSLGGALFRVRVPLLCCRPQPLAPGERWAT